MKYILMAVVFLGGCATGPAPVWQQELNNINRQWRDGPELITPEPKGATRPDNSLDGLLACGALDDYR